MVAQLTLIGRIAADMIRTTLDTGGPDADYARFLVHALAQDEVVAVVGAVTSDTELARRVEVWLPRYKYEGIEGVPDAFLTDESATELRHKECAREGRVIVLGDDSQMQSLAQVARIDADTLLDDASSIRWIASASDGLSLSGEIEAQWHAALRALLRIDRASLRQVAGYVSAVAAELGAGATLPRALGRSLTALCLPRHDSLFEDIPKTKLRQPSQWQQRLESHWRRECYISKRDLSQVPFSRAKLRDKLEELRPGLRDEVQAVLAAYVVAPDGVSDASFAPFRHDWSELRQFFEEAQKSDGRSLGQETYDFYRIRDPEMLTPTDREYLEAFRQHRRQNPSKILEDDIFYGAHAHELREEPRLAALWDRFIFGQQVECRDLLDGLAQCMRRVYQPAAREHRILVVEANERNEVHFLPLNDEVCRAFATHYRGLSSALSGVVEFRNVKAFDYPSFCATIAGYARRTAQATGRRARQLTFKVWLETRSSGSAPTKSAELRLVWEYDLNAVGTSLGHDLSRLLDNRAGTPLVRCVASRTRTGDRAHSSGLDLNDVACLEPTAGRDRGTFVPARSRCQSLSAEWLSALTRLVEDGLLAESTSEDLVGAFKAFETAYRQALQDLAMQGSTSPSVDEQARLFGELLGKILDCVDRPVALERLLKPILEVGVAQVEGSGTVRPAAVVCPWQPLRLAALAARWRMFRSQLARLLSPEEIVFTDSGALFFAELRRALDEPARPDVVVGWHTTKPTVLGFANGVNGYSLHELPVTAMGAAGPTSDAVGPIARQISELVQDYLRLQPHEKDNLSVVLYNCDAAALPQAVVDQIRVRAEREGRDAMCQVVLRHRNEEQLRTLYKQLVAWELDDDGLHTSEVTRDFMARLRISIMVNQGPAVASPDGPPLDIVFCHDVISRAATLDWSELPRITRAAAEIDPGHWSRRRPIRRGDRDAVVYLSCPAQPSEGWDFIDAVAALHVPDRVRKAREEGTSLVPARRTDVQDPGMRQILEETHRLGSWVINFDDLLDRRQLIERDIRIIRYKHAATGGRNLVISSQASDSLLRATLKGRIRALDPDYSDTDLETLSRRLINDANAISGDIVLRAAKRGTNASELIGVVLSKFLVEAELGTDAPRAWIFLDDYAAWLGQDEKRIADLLCLAPRAEAESGPTLDIVITEAKYVAAASAAAKAKESARQLRDTLLRLERALDPARPPADRNIWLARLSDMLMDGLREPPSPAHEAIDWRTIIRDGHCRIDLRGYSHVFAHAAPGSSDTVSDDAIGVPPTSTGLQERYSSGSLRQLLRCYAERRDPGPLRTSVTGGVARRSQLASRLASDDRSALDDLSLLANMAPSQDDQENAVATLPESAGVDEVPPGQAPSRFLRLIARMAASEEGDRQDLAWLQEAASKCRQALLSYGMSARLEHNALTPNAALLKFKGSDDLTVASVEKKVEELKSTHSLTVLSVRAEPGRVVISIQRPHREVLTLARVWRDWVFTVGQANTRLLIAVKEDDGSPIFLEPDPAPHTLVAGSTGSGKSVLVQNLLLAVAATNHPELARIVLIDPKSGVDYFPFEPLPHLDGGIIDDQESALAKLEGLVAEMDRRYSLFKATRVSNLNAFNRRSDVRLPTIWLVHDEFADWMQVESYRSRVEIAVSRLGVKARAAGIYLVFAAQRPDNTVFPMQLRSNLGNRLVLRVDSAGTSDLSLGVKGGGAERLLGKGHLAALIGGGTEPIFAQVPYVSEEALTGLVEAICRDLRDA